MTDTAAATWSILLVEDDDSIRRMLSRMIAADGHAVIEADSGLTGLRALDRAPVDLVITDVVMADMDGLELLRQIRRRPQAPRVIVISGGGRGTDGTYLELARHFGATSTLSKPVARDDLRAAIDQVMRTCDVAR